MFDNSNPYFKHDNKVIPKTTATLKEGDFCFIPRSDGKYVPFVYLFQYSKKRTSIYGGIVNAVVNTPDVSVLPTNLEIHDHAVLHIKCFKENNTPIVGNIADRIDGKILRKIRSDVTDMKVGFELSVWGYKTLLKYADEV